VYNDKFLENKLPIFPTEEEWTLTLHLDRVPMNDCFPRRYAVNSLPTAVTSTRPQQQNHTRNKDKRQGKQPVTSKQTPQDGDNNSIENYFTRSQPTASSSNVAQEVGKLLGPGYAEEPANYAESFPNMDQLMGGTISASLTVWN
jgi:hypothetical protein